jgi:hypothetical protein
MHHWIRLHCDRLSNRLSNKPTTMLTTPSRRLCDADVHVTGKDPAEAVVAYRDHPAVGLYAL